MSPGWDPPQDHPLTLSQRDARIWSLSRYPPLLSFWKTDLRKCETGTTAPQVLRKLPFNQIFTQIPWALLVKHKPSYQMCAYKPEEQVLLLQNYYNV